MSDLDETFDLSEELVLLLRNSYVSRDLSWVETGAAEIDGKRPYGNSDVWMDIAELLGWEFDEDEGLTDEQIAEAQALHNRTPKALQVILSSGSFEPGLYQNTDPYGHNWKRLESSSR